MLKGIDENNTTQLILVFPNFFEKISKTAPEETIKLLKISIIKT